MKHLQNFEIRSINPGRQQRLLWTLGYWGREIQLFIYSSPYANPNIWPIILRVMGRTQPSHSSHCCWNYPFRFEVLRCLFAKPHAIMGDRILPDAKQNISSSEQLSSGAANKDNRCVGRLIVAAEFFWFWSYSISCFVLQFCYYYSLPKNLLPSFAIPAYHSSSDTFFCSTAAHSPSIESKI